MRNLSPTSDIIAFSLILFCICIMYHLLCMFVDIENDEKAEIHFNAIMRIVKVAIILNILAALPIAIKYFTLGDGANFLKQLFERVWEKVIIIL